MIAIDMKDIRTRVIREIVQLERDKGKHKTDQEVFAKLGLFLFSTSILRLDDDFIYKQMVLSIRFAMCYWIRNERSNGMIGVSEDREVRLLIDKAALLQEKSIVEYHVANMVLDGILMLWDWFCDDVCFDHLVDEVVISK